MVATHIDSAARVTLPEAMMKALGLHPGDEIAIEAIDGKLVIAPVMAEFCHDMSDPAFAAIVAAAAADRSPTIPIDEAFAEVRAQLEDLWRANDA